MDMNIYCWDPKPSRLTHALAINKPTKRSNGFSHIKEDDVVFVHHTVHLIKVLYLDSRLDALLGVS